MNNLSDMKIAENNTIASKPNRDNPSVIKPEKLGTRKEQSQKGISSYDVYKFLIKVFLIYIFPGLFLIILVFVEMTVFRAECNIETGSELCFWHIYIFLLFFYYIFPFPFIIPTAIFIILELTRKEIKKHKTSPEVIKRALNNDL